MEARTYRKILVTAEGPICTVTLNNPDRRNAIGPEMIVAEAQMSAGSCADRITVSTSRMFSFRCTGRA